MIKEKGDFTADGRLIFIACLAIPVGVMCAFVAVALQRLIGFFTNFFYNLDLSIPTRMIDPNMDTLGLAAILIPVLGGLIIGLMARYGSERIRGHGIPEAMEAILIGQSRMQPRVAILKPLSSAISIGSGGPFGAEGPIIMTGGALAPSWPRFSTCPQPNARLCLWPARREEWPRPSAHPWRLCYWPSSCCSSS